MFKMNFDKVESFRQTTGAWGTRKGNMFGLFYVTRIGKGVPLKVICAPADSEWQHVSVSLPDRCPTWEEMNRIKNLFWEEDTTVVQFHPKKSEYVNHHPYCLHLWRKRDSEFELPPQILVGPT